jgi:hypothetical protein
LVVTAAPTLDPISCFLLHFILVQRHIGYTDLQSGDKESEDQHKKKINKKNKKRKKEKQILHLKGKVRS